MAGFTIYLDIDGSRLVEQFNLDLKFSRDGVSVLYYRLGNLYSCVLFRWLSTRESRFILVWARALHPVGWYPSHS